MDCIGESLLPTTHIAPEARIGNSNGILPRSLASAPAPRGRPAGAAHSAAERGLDMQLRRGGGRPSMVLQLIGPALCLICPGMAWWFRRWLFRKEPRLRRPGSPAAP